MVKNKLKSIAKKIRDSGRLGYCLIQCFLKLHALYFSFFSDKKLIEYEFKQVFGYKLDWKAPKTFNEKINWLKRFGCCELQATCSDKILVRDYVAQAVGGEILIPKILSTYCVRDICPENIKQKSFVMKVNHDSGGILICHDREHFDWEFSRKQLKKWLRRDFYRLHRERQYKDIRRGIIVEKLLKSSDGLNLIDYRLFCFHGKLKMVQVKTSNSGDYKNNLYDAEWALLPVLYNGCDNADVSIYKPKPFEEMRRIAEKLSAPFNFARIDLYVVDDKVYFGEITFTPNAGLGKFQPESFDFELGSFLRLNEKIS